MLSKIRKLLFKPYYPDFIKWTQQLPINTPIQSVKQQQPKYIIIDWEKPEKLGTGFLYPVLKIKGHHEDYPQNLLGFVDNLYTDCVFRK